MKAGRNLQELAMEIQRQAEAKHDYIAPTGDIRVLIQQEDEGDNVGRWIEMQVGDFGTFRMGSIARDQMADRLAVPRSYFGRLFCDHPGLLETTINHILHNEPRQQMVRTMDGRVRAFLSDRYRPLDNDVIAETVLPILAGNSGFEVASAEVTEQRLYIKALFPGVQGEVRVGDVVQGGIAISNSEIGFGAVKVEPLIYRLVCRNGMIAADHSVRRMHIGGGNGGGDGAREFWHDDTKRATDIATLKQIRDTVTAVTQQQHFDSMLATLRAAAGRDIPQGADIPTVVELTSKKLDLFETERKGILDHLVRGGDLTQWGLANAVTRFSQDVADYDRATELERLGSAVVNWNDREWQNIARAN